MFVNRFSDKILRYSENDTVALCQICRSYMDTVGVTVHSDLGNAKNNKDADHIVLEFVSSILSIIESRDIFVPNAPKKLPKTTELIDREYFLKTTRFAVETYQKYHKGMFHEIEKERNTIDFVKKRRPRDLATRKLEGLKSISRRPLFYLRHHFFTTSPVILYFLQSVVISTLFFAVPYLIYREFWELAISCLLYTSPSPRDKRQSRMPSSA